MRISNHIKSAVGSLSQHNKLSHDFMTTLDFGQLCPTMCLPLLPRDKIHLNASCFCRVAPMIFPTYGSCDIVTNFHSVTYSQVWKFFEAFVTGNRFDGITSIAFPCIKSSAFYLLFLNSSYSYEGAADSSNHDLVVFNSDGTTSYRFLTLFGRYVRKVLSSLGYPYFVNLYQTIPANVEDNIFSALPLMCFFKIYSDFYESRQYFATSVVREVLRQCFELNSTDVSSYFSAGTPTTIEGVNVKYFSGLSILFSHLKLLFESDYVTSAQTYPSLVGGSQRLSFSKNEGPSGGFYQSVTLNQNNTSTAYAQAANNVGGDVIISQSNPMHRLLDNFENLVRRFNLVGSREIDRIRAMFGIRPAFSSSFYSNFHGGFSSPLQVQDVTSTSAEPSVDNYLGSYAGKGISSNGKSFTIESNDFGLLIGVSFVRVRPLYVPGLSREVLKTSMTGYYNPDFDHGYPMAIANGEVQSFQRINTGISLTSVFGFQNAYDDYRQHLSRVNGDFLDTELLSWSFVRDNVGSVAQSDNVIYFNQPSTTETSDMYTEFQRVFVDGSGRDHFYASFGFNISALRPVRTSSESFDLGVGNVSTSNNPVI